MSGVDWSLALTWALFVLYAVVTAGLAVFAGLTSNKSASSFAIGSGQMNPVVVGVTLGASLASSATFVFYPGYVHADGLGALMGFSVALIAGLLTGLVVFTPRFQDVGAQVAALTVPHWIGERFQDLGLRRLFAGLQVLNVAYLVLITVGCAKVMHTTLNLPYHVALVGIIVFVFGYTALGGATAHAFTNTLQGVVMLAVSCTVFVSGLTLWPQAWTSLQSTGWTAPQSKLFSSHWEVWLVSYLIGVALTTQPHLLAKALYVKGRRSLAITIAVGISTYATFALMLSAGAYARVVLPADTPINEVVGEYITYAFSGLPLIGAVVTVAILAASMSTLDGLLVAVAASVGNDFLPGKGKVWINRVVLVVLAAATLAISWDPPEALVFAQAGVYAVVAASIGPLMAGLWQKGPLARWPIWISAIVPLVVHFALYKTVFVNPGVTALIGMAAGVPFAVLTAFVGRPPVSAPDATPAAGEAP